MSDIALLHTSRSTFADLEHDKFEVAFQKLSNLPLSYTEDGVQVWPSGVAYCIWLEMNWSLSDRDGSYEAAAKELLRRALTSAPSEGGDGR